MYKEEPEVSEGAIRYTKMMSLVSIILLTVIFDGPLLRELSVNPYNSGLRVLFHFMYRLLPILAH